MNFNTISKRSIFKKLVLMFIIIIIPIYFVGYYIYNWGITAIRGAILDSMSSQLTYYIDELEKEISRIQIIQYECLSDSDLDRLSNAPNLIGDFEKTQAINRLQNRLSTVAQSSVYIDDVRVHIAAIEKTISAQRGYMQIQTEEYDLLAAQKKSESEILHFEGNRIYVIVKYPAPSLYKDRKPSYILVSELSKDAFIDAISRFGKDNDSGAIMIAKSSDEEFSLDSPTGMNDIPTRTTLLNAMRGNQIGSTNVSIRGKTYILIQAYSGILGIKIARYIPDPYYYESLSNYRILFFIFTLCAVSIIIIFSLSIHRMIHRPLLQLIEAFHCVETGNLQIRIKHLPGDEFMYIFSGFNSMVENLNTQIDQVYRQKMLAQKSELKQLQSQINPHFLYNTFFSMHSLAKAEGNETIMEFTRHLGKYFKYITRNTADDISLQEEVDHARTYSDIQMIRLGKRISVQFDAMPDEFQRIFVPRLILQPIIENAFEHGLKEKMEHGLIHIGFTSTPRYAVIFVEDNGETLTDGEIHALEINLEAVTWLKGTTGVININRRLHLQFGDEFGIQVYRSDMGGLKIVMKLPKEGGSLHDQTSDS